jgi:hypothetical protein
MQCAWKCSSVVEELSSLYEVLSFIPRIARIKCTRINLQFELETNRFMSGQFHPSMFLFMYKHIHA